MAYFPKFTPNFGWFPENTFKRPRDSPCILETTYHGKNQVKCLQHFSFVRPCDLLTSNGIRIYAYM